jgi:hypothetical protein
MTWTDGLTCSVLRDGDAAAEAVAMNIPGNDLWHWTARISTGCGVGSGEKGRENAKAAAERAIRRMRVEDEE